ncbi:MAG: tRNA 2-thiouridine(34) synthase MnmA [Candidatus Omnitrophota bacterium]
MKKRVVLAMSGGVDSSVAAYLLKKRGYSVIGVTFKVWPKSFCKEAGPKSCCSFESISDARSTCDQLNIPHYVINCEKLFKDKVIDTFIKSYKNGLTPNPCVICNERVKFPVLMNKAGETGSNFIATGHYAKSTYSRRCKRYFIKEARDKNKDQSYVLFSLTQDILSKLILPVGDFSKQKIVSIAKRLKLKSYHRKESQEICFIPDDDLNKFLSEHLSNKIKRGSIKTKEGKVLGEHQGTCFYTIGQRKGLRISYGKPIYVIDIDHKNGDIIIGSHNDTLKKVVTANDTSWNESVKKGQLLKGVMAKIRYKHPKAKAEVAILTSKTAEVNFLKAQSSPTPGQAVVFYRRDAVLGGGWITR